MHLPARTRPLLVAVGVLIATGSFAQGLDALKNSTPKERAEAQTAMMKTKLGLTDDQVSKVRALNLKYAEQMQPIINGTEGPLMKMRDARNVEDQKEAELKGLLSPDQFQKFQAMKEEMREKLMDQIQQQRNTGS